MDAINAVFRGFHTIKGVAGFIALDGIGNLAHAAEELLDHARKGQTVLRGAHLDLVFEAVDVMKHAVEDVNRALGGDGIMHPPAQLALLARRIKASLEEPGPEDSAGTAVHPGAGRLGQILVARGDTSAEAVNDALERQRARERDPLGAILRHGSLVSAPVMQEALRIQEAERPNTPIGEILIAMGAVSRDDLEAALQAQRDGTPPPRIGEILVAQGDATPQAVVSALRAQRAEGAEAAPASGGVAVREAVKVDAFRLDQLVDTIGELVIAETMVTQAPELRAVISPALRRRIRQLEKISRELQEMATSLRMVPVRSTFQKMARLVRDLAKKTGKPVEFSMSGEETELDKSVVDKIGDPLVHMIRNAVDHGLEDSPEDRVRAGKAPVGQIALRAYHQGGNIHIEITDDGRGLNRDAILRKAVERGLVPAGESPDDRTVHNLIFEPGFSTAQKLTEVSGRGVGMDVVKRNITALRGQVEITSEPGRGSCFTIRLPLTLAIIDGMVVRVGTERFIVPTLSIVLSVRPRPEELHSAVGSGEMLSLRGRLLPLYRLGRVLDIPRANEDPLSATVMVVESDGRQAGLLIDEILGQQQIVIKPLGQYLRGVPGLSGGAIMPDGNVGLVLDIPGLVRLATQPPDPAHNGNGAHAHSLQGGRSHG
jgi:two-component system chemotaxis sensor kinase CheA